MRKIFQCHLLTESNQYIKNQKKNNNNISERIRPITTNTSLKNENPIKLLNRREINSNINKNIVKSSTNYSFYNQNSKSNNKHNYLNKNLKNLSEGQLNIKLSKNILPIISQTESNNELKLNKKKLEDIINMFKNEPDNNCFLQKKLKFKHRGLVQNIPNDLFERLKFNYKIFKNNKFIEYVKEAPDRKESEIEDIADYLWKFNKSHNKIEKFYALFFYYLCTNIQYDVEKINEYENNVNRIFRSGYANSLQFCKLFETMCRRHSLRVNRIEGFCKSKEYPNYKKGTDVTKSNHYWNVIFFNNNWYFVDLTFGSGGLKQKHEKTNMKEYFNPYYFLTPSEYLIVTHRPLNDIWQMTEKIIPANIFSNKSDVHMGEFYKQVYEHQIDLISHKFPIIKCTDKKLDLKMGIEDMNTQAFLYFSNYKTKSTEIKTEYDKQKKELTIEHNFDLNGEYLLEVLYRDDDSNDIKYLPLINYKIIVNNAEEKFLQNLKKKRKIKLNDNFLYDLKWKKSKIYKNKNLTNILLDHEQIKFYSKQSKICIDNEGAHLLSPNAKNIKIGQINEFKVKVPYSDIVCVLDGHDWHYLKRNRNDKNIFFGNIEIKNENVMILTLRDNKVFTEIFKLKAHYVTSNLLRLSQHKKENSKNNKKANNK